MTKLNAQALIGSLMALTVGLSSGVALGTSETGAYLSARHAARNDDATAAARYYSRALAADPKHQELMEQALLYKVSAGQITSAIPIARTLADKSPRQRIAQLTLLAHELEQGEFEAAKKRIDDSGSTAFHPVTANLVGGWAEYGEGDLKGAVEKFDALEGQELYRVFANYHKGLAASSEDAELAKESFEASMGENPPSVRLAEAYGRFLQIEGNTEAAKELYAKALDAAPADPIIGGAAAKLSKGENTPKLLVTSAAGGAAEALYGLASAFARDDSGVRLSLIYTQLALHLDPSNEAAQLLLGNLLEAQERWDEAAEAYEAFGSNSDYYRHAQVGRAEAYSRIDRVDDALSALGSLEETFPEDESIPIAMGDLLRRSERYDEARSAYDRAVDIVGEDQERYWSLYYARGVANERIGEWDNAQEDLLRALDHQPDQAHVLNYLGYSWIEQGSNFDRARKMIERAVELRPDDGYITDSLGWVQYKLGDFEDAVATMERAVELVPTDPVINDHYGDTLWIVGRKLEARFQWKRALSFDPEEPGMKERIRRKLDVGLDVVLKEEAEEEESEAAGIEDDAPKPDDG